MDFALFVHPAHFRGDGVAPQPLVDHFGHFIVDGQAVPAVNFHHHIESRRPLAFQHALLRAAVARLLVAQGNRLNAADEVGQGGVHNEVIQGVAVGGGDQLDAALGDGAGGGGLALGAHFVDDDDLRHMVFHRLDHHAVLLRRGGNLHPAGAADGRVRHIAIAGDFVGGVDDDDALMGFHRQHAGHFPQHGGFAHAGAAQQQQILAGEGQIFDELDGAEHGAPHPAGEADDAAPAVADGGNAVQRPFQAGAVVAAELAQAVDGRLQVGFLHFALREFGVAVDEPRFRRPPQVQHHFQQLFQIVPLPQRRGHPLGQHFQHLFQLIPGSFQRRRQTTPPPGPNIWELSLRYVLMRIAPGAGGVIGGHRVIGGGIQGLTDGARPGPAPENTGASGSRGSAPGGTPSPADCPAAPPPGGRRPGRPAPPPPGRCG